MSSLLLDDVVRLVETEGRAGLNRWKGPFLLEIRIEDPSNLVVLSEDPRTPSSRSTEAYPVDDLLHLRRVRGVKDVRIYPLRHEAVAGRGKDCYIQLGDPAAALSKQHAKFLCEGEGWSLSDLGSRNGTYVDRKEVNTRTPRPLKAFSHIQLGDKRFVFLGTDELYDFLAPVRTSDPIPIQGLATELESLGSRKFLLRHDTPHLLVEIDSKGRNDFRPQQAHPLTGGTSLTVGRSREANIHLPGRSVSKLHARIFQREGKSGWYLEDTGSSYGTEKNGAKLQKGEPSRLVDWDSCSFGGPRVCGLFLDSRGLLEFLAEEF